MSYSLVWLPGVLRQAGLKVIEQSGWETRGHGDMSTILGTLLHHTAEPIDDDKSPTLKVLTYGRPAFGKYKELKGPLCHLGLGQSGIYYMIAAGKASHAGPGEWLGVTNGNSHFIGIEAENNGLGEPWPEVQMEAFAKGCAAIAKYCHFPRQMVVGHKEYALPKGRKIDPNFDMDDFRWRVRRIMKETS